VRRSAPDPLVSAHRQATKLIGALYLENNLTPGAFTPERLAVLEMLLRKPRFLWKNATLYSDLHRSEAFLAQGQSLSQTGSSAGTFLVDQIDWSNETYNIFD